MKGLGLKAVVAAALAVAGRISAGALRGQLTMTEADELPTIHLRLRPFYSVEEEDSVGSLRDNSKLPVPPTGINITMRLKPPLKRLGKGLPLLELPLQIGPTPSARYDGDAVVAHDEFGYFKLSYKDDDPEADIRTWYQDRDPIGNEIVVHFFAPARKSDENTPLGPRVDLRKDQNGGLVGQGVGFIPSPPAPRGEAGASGDGAVNAVYDPWEITVEWDLTDAPEGTKGVWSLGDVSPSIAVESPDRGIGHGVFAVGQLQRYPPWDEDLASQDSKGGVYAMYWMGPTPWDMIDLARKTQQIYSDIAAYFSSPDPFRVFFRQIENGEGGTGATYSFVVEWSAPTTETTTPHGMLDLLAHETVHEYALLESPIGDSSDEMDAWYDEGIANYIGALVGLPREDMVRSMNGYAQAYYTSPAVGLEYGYVLEHYWENMHVTRVPYYRGLVYLAQLNGMIRSATEGKHSIDDVVVELYKLRVEHERCDMDKLKEIVAGYVGERTLNETFDAMLRGDLIVPGEDCLAEHGLKMVRRDLEKFELGFDANSMRTRKIKDLVPCSNAEKAGVREGDEIVRGYMVWVVADEMENMMSVTVKRSWGEEKLMWWPRSSEKVEAYTWVDTQKEDGMGEL